MSLVLSDKDCASHHETLWYLLLLCDTQSDTQSDTWRYSSRWSWWLCLWSPRILLILGPVVIVLVKIVMVLSLIAVTQEHRRFTTDCESKPQTWWWNDIDIMINLTMDTQPTWSRHLGRWSRGPPWARYYRTEAPTSAADGFPDMRLASCQEPPRGGSNLS